MKRILYAVLATVSGLVLLFSYKTSLEVVTPEASSGSATTESPTSATGSGNGGSGSGSDSTGSSSTGSSSTGSSSSSSSSTTSSGAGTTLTDGTYTGDAASTRFGPVQTRITVSGGVITAVDVVQYPSSNGRDRQINERAIPLLVTETLQAQSSSIDMVSGATYTSTGYVKSLQSAIDQAQP